MRTRGVLPPRLRPSPPRESDSERRVRQRRGSPGQQQRNRSPSRQEPVHILHGQQRRAKCLRPTWRGPTRQGEEGGDAFVATRRKTHGRTDARTHTCTYAKRVRGRQTHTQVRVYAYADARTDADARMVARTGAPPTLSHARTGARERKGKGGAHKEGRGARTLRTAARLSQRASNGPFLQTLRAHTQPRRLAGVCTLFAGTDPDNTHRCPSPGRGTPQPPPTRREGPCSTTPSLLFSSCDTTPRRR